MPVPDFQSLMLPLLRITGDEIEHSLVEVVERLLIAATREIWRHWPRE